MAIRMIDTQSHATVSQISEKELRRQINKSVDFDRVGDFVGDQDTPNPVTH